MLHVVMWCVTATSTFLTYYDAHDSFIAQVCNAAMVALGSTVPFYITAYYLIPKYLYKKRYAVFITFMFLLIIFSGLFLMVAVRSVVTAKKY